MWGHEDWRAFGTMLSGLAQLAGAFAAAWYFLRRMIRGSLIPDLSLSVLCDRTRCEHSSTDWLLIRVALKKGERGTLSLLDAQANVIAETTSTVAHFWGCLLAPTKNNGAQLDWNQPAGVPLPINLTPGEETEFAAVVEVPAGQICRMQVVVLARQYGESRIGQWQASSVSLPITPNQGMHSSGRSGVN